MKVLLIAILLIIGFNCKSWSQDLFWIYPIDISKAYMNDGLYFPDHDIKIKEGQHIYLNKRLIFSAPLPKVYSYYYEIFEDNTKEQYLIVTPVFKTDDNYSAPEIIPRRLLYIIELKGDFNAFYTKLNGFTRGNLKGLTLNSQRDYNYYKNGNLIKLIDSKRRRMKIMRHDNGDDPFYEEYSLYKLEL